MSAPHRPLVTKIHGRYYDVGSFDHPGGCSALECGRDRDATALFESYHALHRARPLKTLSQFEVTAEQAERADRFMAEKKFGPSGFDWDATLAGGFRADLVGCARRYFEAERTRRRLPSITAATKAPPRRWIEVAGLAMLFFLALVLFVRGNWIAVLAVPLFGWLFMVNFWHDALHFAMSRHWRANALMPYVFPWFMSPKLWMHQHVIGHHVFPNDPERDPDVRAAPRIIRQTLRSAWCPAHAGQRRVGWLLALYSIVCLARNLMRDHLTRAAGWFNGAVPLVFGTARRRWVHIAGRIIVAWSLFVWPFQVFPFWKALAFATVPSLLLSELFALFSQINHVTEQNVLAAERRSADWYAAQVEASCSYAMDSYAAFLLSGGLNLQIEHHLFPGVNHVHLFRLSPEIQRICQRHGVPYHSYPTLWTALRAHFAFMKRLADAPAALPPLEQTSSRI
jgi:fatty acid desaturase